MRAMKKPLVYCLAVVIVSSPFKLSQSMGE